MVATIINIILVEDLLARTTHSKGSGDQHISLLASLAYALYILTVCKAGAEMRGNEIVATRTGGIHWPSALLKLHFCVILFYYLLHERIAYL